jgi:flavin-dependent dehydrogenase
LGKQVIAKYQLNEGRDTQTFAIGIKELWEIDPAKAKPGLVVHTSGWPMQDDTFGGGFLYHLEDNKVTLGFVLGLDYKNPWLSPFEEMQRWKTHWLWRTRHQQRYAASPAPNSFPRWCAGGLRRGLHERRTHQGQPCRHQERRLGG